MPVEVPVSFPLTRVAQALAAVCLVLLVVMAGRPFFTNASRPERGIADPQIALQMAASVGEIDAIFADVPSPDREVMRVKQYIDFWFLGAYTLLALVLSEILARRSKAGRILGLLALLGAAFDARENMIILKIIDTPLASTTQAMINTLHSTSLAKWAFTLAAVATLGVFWLTAGPWFLRVIGGVELGGALLAAVSLRENAILPWAAAVLATGVLLNAATLKFLNITNDNRNESSTPDPIPRPV